MSIQAVPSSVKPLEIPLLKMCSSMNAANESNVAVEQTNNVEFGIMNVISAFGNMCEGKTSTMLAKSKNFCESTDNSTDIRVSVFLRGCLVPKFQETEFVNECFVLGKEDHRRFHILNTHNVESIISLFGRIENEILERENLNKPTSMEQIMSRIRYFVTIDEIHHTSLNNIDVWTQLIGFLEKRRVEALYVTGLYAPSEDFIFPHFLTLRDYYLAKIAANDSKVPNIYYDNNDIKEAVGLSRDYKPEFGEWHVRCSAVNCTEKAYNRTTFFPDYEDCRDEQGNEKDVAHECIIPKYKYLPGCRYHYLKQRPELVITGARDLEFRRADVKFITAESIDNALGIQRWLNMSFIDSNNNVVHPKADVQLLSDMLIANLNH